MEFTKPMEDAFRYCPRCATAADDVGEHPFRCHQCGFTFFFGPVTAVGGILRDPEGNILLIRRANDPGKGLLGMPGGFVDRGETAEEALIREIKEEVGLDVDQLSYLTTLPNNYTYQGLTSCVLDLFFLCELPSFEGLSSNPEEVSDLWIGLPTEEQLDQMAFHSNRMALLEYLRSDRK